ncbi:iron uptake transporter permease EfeU [Tatumella ptyseos]|uniref:iron uptake transporter permease EfeU n=1 Tax=Tatumella ptyseos TaxID=82987 RepID=UPI0026EE948E|nr:iron uptake transporter permease EfeU [Tatumella ptyseos]WKX25374.1 iron uptake transporter permease EfeU [Tatumella ptyseos]
MLATLVIALREGLEAVLIVSIIATFLRKNQQPLAPMWWGVVAAVLLSIVVGVGLSLTERALPQAEQEAMEAIIGTIAVIFVSSMIIWMQQHAPQLKHQLESEASLALRHSSRWALPSMAFLAVLKEGFETSVFMLATFSAAQSSIWATVGAVVGLVLALVIGWGIYRGGIRLNLGRFFKITGIFLIFVAAGLVVSALRSAHEAGWLLIGQHKVLDLYWLLPAGSIRAALITGVMGIPADPRGAEVLGWLSYLVLFLVVLAWPQRFKPSPKVAYRLLQSVSFITLVGAFFCAKLLSPPPFQLSPSLPLVSQQATKELPIGTLTRKADGLELTLNDQSTRFIPFSAPPVAPVPEEKIITLKRQWPDAPTQLSLDQVITLYHQRVPPGLHPQQHPGPYQSQWQLSCQITLTLQQGEIIAAHSTENSLLTLRGSGLSSPRLLSVTLSPAVVGCPWQTSAAWQRQVNQALTAYQETENLYDFLQHKLPIVLILISLGALALSVGSKKKRHS